MKKYSPGEYEITLRGTTGTNYPVSTEGLLILTLINPCPFASITSLVETPFNDKIYLLGS